MIDEFTTGPDNVKDRLNQIIDEIENLRKITGSDYINVNSVFGGKTVSLNTNKLRELFPTSTGGVRRAITTAAAGAAATIVCNLYDSNGVEVTAGDEFEVTVYCEITGTDTTLDEAIPALEDDMDIWIQQSNYDNEGTPELRWYCIQIFQKMDICPLDV